MENTALHRRAHGSPIRFIPNALTTVRIGMAPCVTWLLWNERWQLALYVFFLACITDFLDGFIARRWCCSSRWGKILDAFADKVLLGCGLAGAFPIVVSVLEPGFARNLLLFLFFLILIRDVLILCGSGMLLLKKSPPVVVSWVGKVHVFVLAVAGIFSLIWLSASHNGSRIILGIMSVGLCMTACGTAVLSLVHYARVFLGILRHHQRSHTAAH